MVSDRACVNVLDSLLVPESVAREISLDDDTLADGSFDGVCDRVIVLISCDTDLDIDEVCERYDRDGSAVWEIVAVWEAFEKERDIDTSQLRDSDTDF